MNSTAEESVPLPTPETVKPRRKPNRGRPLLKWTLIAVCVAAAVWGGLRYWNHPQSAALDYKTTPVSRGDVVQSVSANGSLTPVQLVEVGSQISGVITQIKVDFNSQVTAGEIIAQIDPATYERAQGQAEAELTSSQAGQELAQLNFDRGKALFASQLISKSDFDQLRVNLSQANAAVKTRQASLESTKVDLSRTTIHAPIDGIVITRKVEAGQTVAAAMSTPTLFTIANDLHKMRIEAAVSEADIGGVEEGQKVQFSVDAFPGRLFEGVVSQVRYAPSTNQGVVSYTSVVDVDNKDLKLRPGMTANARFITAERKGVLKLPLAAIRFRPPASALVVGDTNAATAKGGSLIEKGPFAGLPVMPWMSEQRRPTEAEREAYVKSLTADQKQKYDKAVTELRTRMTQGGSPGGGGAMGGQGPRPSAEPTEQLKSATVYLKEKPDPSAPVGQIVLRAVTVKLGIADSTSVEVQEGLKETDEVISGTITAASTAPKNPLGSPFGGPGRR